MRPDGRAATDGSGGSGLESDFSAELAVKIALPPLPVSRGGISTNTSGPTGLDWFFPVAVLDSSPEFIVEASADLVAWAQGDTAQPAESTSGDAQPPRFSWPFATKGPRKFYRLTARNWMGGSTGP